MPTPDTGAPTDRPRPAAGETREARLAAVWERARQSERYAQLPPYSARAFHALPPTPKAELKDDPWGFVTIDLGDAARYYETTGTTGVVTPTPRTREDIELNLGSVATGWSTLVADGDRVLSLLPSDIVPVGDLVVDVCDRLGAVVTRAYPYAQGISDWDRILPLWERLGPTVLFAAPGVVRELTKFALARGMLDDLNRSVSTIMLLGEVSTDSMRASMGSWWQAAVVDASYGSTECGTLATGCTAGRLHLLPGSHLVEIRGSDGKIVDADQRAGDGVLQGDLLVTTLHAHARPLLRLEMGDEVSIGLPCVCGSSRPSLKVHGRTADGLTVGDRRVAISVVEEHVYECTTALGYLVEVDDDDHPTRMRLLLERAPGSDRADEAEQGQRLGRALSAATGLSDVTAGWLNNLPATTRSGASQKNWKASNVRVGTW